MKQDYFTRDTHKPVEHKKVGSEVRISGVEHFRRSLKERAAEKALNKAKK